MYVDESEATAWENDFEMRDMDGCDILMQSLLICCSDPDAYNLIAANTWMIGGIALLLFDCLTNLSSTSVQNTSADALDMRYRMWNALFE